MPYAASKHDQRVRLAAFEWLKKQTCIHGEVLSRQLLTKGFLFEGERVPLVSPQGIFKPRILDIPLTITTVPDGPYADQFSRDGLLSYKYRGTDPNHRDNVGLRQAMTKAIPLIYLFGVVQSRYLAVYPVFVVRDDPLNLSFSIAVEDRQLLNGSGAEVWDGGFVGDGSTAVRRGYITRSVKTRLHQHSFREKVLRAYREQCALCHLRHGELLDAAHITPDSDPEGEPEVQNGLALCKLHHAAFDRYFLGIRPDYIIEVRSDILRETDGPMLLHGLQGLDGKAILLPRNRSLRPDTGRLAERFEEFRKVG